MTLGRGAWRLALGAPGTSREPKLRISPHLTRHRKLKGLETDARQTHYTTSVSCIYSYLFIMGDNAVMYGRICYAYGGIGC